MGVIKKDKTKYIPAGFMTRHQITSAFTMEITKVQPCSIADLVALYVFNGLQRPTASFRFQSDYIIPSPQSAFHRDRDVALLNL